MEKTRTTLTGSDDIAQQKIALLQQQLDVALSSAQGLFLTVVAERV